MPAPVLTALCLSTLALPVQSGARLIRRLDVAFESSKRTEDVYDARSRALAGVRSLDSAALVEALADAYATLEREADPIVARRQRLLLRGGGNSLVIQRRKLDPIHVLQDRILERLQGLESHAAHTRMLALMLRGKKPIPVLLRVRFAALVSRLGPAALTRSLADGEKTLEDALVLLRSIAGLGIRGRSLGPWVVSKLASESESVRLEAVDALEALRWPGSLPGLIDRLEVEDAGAGGRLVRLRIAGALERLTGKSLGSSAISWRGWLENEGAALVRSDEPLARREPREKQKKKPRVRGPSASHYFGLPQEGGAILYVYDRSLSMRGPRASPRIDRSRRELVRALERLGPEQRFNILAFATRIQLLDEKLLPATPRNVARARTWLEDMKLEFGTNSYDALELAFITAGRGRVDRWYEPLADTVFFLSDGAPTVAAIERRGVKADLPERILSAVRRWNPLGRIVVHSIGLGLPRQGRARRFMRRLARENGGRFVTPR